MIVSNPGESLQICIAVWMTKLNNVYVDAHFAVLIYMSTYIYLSQVFRPLGEYFFIQIENNIMQYIIIKKYIRIPIILWSILEDITIRRQISINRCNISCIQFLSMFCVEI